MEIILHIVQFLGVFHLKYIGFFDNKCFSRYRG
jgi:hypothetical protein